MYSLPQKCQSPAWAMLFLLAAAPLPATILYSEAFDSEATAKIERNSGTGMAHSYVDYSAMTVGQTPHSIAEAPRQIGGSLATRGILLQVDYATSPAVAQRIANLVALNNVGGTRLEVTDRFRLKFDFYLRLSPDVTLANHIPNNPGTTEQMLWGVGYSATLPMGRSQTGRGTGMWGWLSTEGGYSAAGGSDASLCSGTSVLFGYNMDGVGGETMSLFAPAFGSDASPVPNCPANQWVEADITVQNGQVTVQYQAVGRTATKFFENVAGPVAGAVMVGYEDSAGSLSFDQDDQWMLLDNLVLEDLIPPTLAVTPGGPFSNFYGTPATSTYTLQNTRTAGDLTVSGVEFSGANATDFSVATPLPLVVPAGGAAPLVISFSPAAPNGIKTASFTIISDDPETPSYPVSGLRGRRSVASFLEAHYKLDEFDGTQLTDSSGEGVTGTLHVRQPVIFAKPSLLGTAETGTSMGFLPAQTSSTGNFITSPVVHTPTFSISFWMKPESTGALRTLFQRDYDFRTPPDKIWGLTLATDGVVKYRVQSVDVIESGPVVTDGSVWHVVLTHLDEDGFGNTTATRSRLYLNGQRVAETTGGSTFGFDEYPANASTFDLHVGSRTAAGSGYAGDLDDIQVYGAELSREQVWELFLLRGFTASPRFSIVDAGFSSGPERFRVIVPSSPGGSYRLFRSGDLQTWDPVGTSISGEPVGVFTSLFDPAPNPAQGYYRVERQ